MLKSNFFSSLGLCHYLPSGSFSSCLTRLSPHRGTESRGKCFWCGRSWRGRRSCWCRNSFNQESTCKLWKAEEMSRGLKYIQRWEKIPEGDRSQGLNLLSLSMIQRNFSNIHFPCIRKGVWCSRTLAEWTEQQILTHSAHYTDAQDFPSRCLSPAL